MHVVSADLSRHQVCNASGNAGFMILSGRQRVDSENGIVGTVHSHLLMLSYPVQRPILPQKQSSVSASVSIDDDGVERVRRPVLGKGRVGIKSIKSGIEVQTPLGSQVGKHPPASVVLKYHRVRCFDIIHE